LFEDLSTINGLERIRFMTSHPLDLTDAIIDAIATLPKVMPYIHIPMQAGDTDVLARMRRGYTAEEYFALTDKIHAKIPGVAITGDFIVGFPGETEAQFAQSLLAVERSGIYMANVAAYSPRQQTPAAIWEQRGDEVPAEVKEDRLQRLNAAIAAAAMQHNAPLQDQTVEVLVEGPSRRNPNRLMGRTPTNKVVNFTTPLTEDDLVGQIIPVHITTPQPFSLLGEHVLLHVSAASNATVSAGL
jgi:tRNA-2-methylthio-N6-dimethylallyladenosine synthase